MLKLVNRTRSPRVVGLLFARPFATLPLVFLLLVLRIVPLPPSAERRESSPPPDSVAPTMVGPALSSWFIASFDCQVHAAPAAESSRGFSHPPPPVCFLSYAPTSTDQLRVVRCRHVPVWILAAVVCVCARDRFYELGS